MQVHTSKILKICVNETGKENQKVLSEVLISGFDNDIAFAKNADFTQADNQNVQESNGLATNGQLWIGTTAVNAGGTHINVGSLTSPDSSITFGYSTPNITAVVAGGATVGKTITGNTGGPLSPVAGNWNIVSTGSLTSAGSGNTLTTSLTGLTNHSVLVGAGTDTITKLAIGTNGQLLTGSTGADPVFATPTSTGGNYIAGAGTSLYIPANYMPGSSNIAFSYSAGTFTVHGYNGTALSATNPGYVTLQSKGSPGRFVTIAVTANQTFTDGSAGTLDNARFGVTTGVNWASDMPFFLYGVSNDAETAIAFMIARNPAQAISPASTSISKSGAIINVSQNDFFSLANITVTDYDNNPCICLGGFRMQFAGATDSYTVQALSSIDGIGNFFQWQPFNFVVGQNGATAAKFMFDNGGTAPSWTNQSYVYYVNRDGSIRIVLEQDGDGGTDGAGAVNATWAMPYNIRIGSAANSGHGSAYVSSSALTFRPALIFCSTSLGLNYFQALYQGAAVLNSDFGNTGRVFGVEFTYLMSQI